MKVYECCLFNLVGNYCISFIVGCNRCLSDAEIRWSLQHTRSLIFILGQTPTQSMLNKLLKELKLRVEEALKDLLFFLILFCSLLLLTWALPLARPYILTCAFDFYILQIGFYVLCMLLRWARVNIIILSIKISFHDV